MLVNFYSTFKLIWSSFIAGAQKLPNPFNSLRPCQSLQWIVNEPVKWKLPWQWQRVTWVNIKRAVSCSWRGADAKYSMPTYGFNLFINFVYISYKNWITEELYGQLLPLSANSIIIYLGHPHTNRLLLPCNWQTQASIWQNPIATEANQWSSEPEGILSLTQICVNQVLNRTTISRSFLKRFYKVLGLV